MQNIWTGKRSPGTPNYYLPVSESDSDLGQCHRDSLVTSSWQVWNAYHWRTWRLLLCWLQTVRAWFSLCSVIHHRASPAMRGTDCEREESSRELRNVYRSNLASGLELRLPIIPAGTSVLLCIFCCMMWIAPHDNLHVFFMPPTALIESTRGPEAPLRKYSEVIGGNRRIWSNSG